MGSPRIVVGLGPVDPRVVGPQLGDGYAFVEHPNWLDLQEAEGAIVRAAHVVDAAAMDRMPNLRVIARTGVGVERVDVAEATRRGIAVTVTPGTGARSVAEAAMTMLTALVRRLPESHRYVVEGHWGLDPAPQPGDLYGLRLGIVGYGRIGRLVAGLARAYGMEVVAHDPYLTDADVPLVPLADLLATSDAVSLHLPGGNGPVLTERELAGARPGLFLINCARAELVAFDVLFAALRSGTLAGVGLDVYPAEPADPHPLFQHPNVLLSPHTAGLSRGALTATVEMAALSVREILDGKGCETAINC